MKRLNLTAALIILLIVGIAQLWLIPNYVPSAHDPGDLPPKRRLEAGVELQSLDHGRRVFALATRELGEVASTLFMDPLPIGDDAHAIEAQRGQDVIDIARQRPGEDDDERLRAVDARVVIGEIGDAMKRDRRLARSGAAPDHEVAAGGPRDQIELDM